MRLSHAPPRPQGVWLVFSQVALRNDSVLWMHTDPVSRMNDSVEVQVINVTVRLAQML